MTNFSTFLSEGINYEKTHQVILEILLKDPLFTEKITGCKIESPIIESEPALVNTLPLIEGRKRAEKIHFDLGIKEKGMKGEEYSVLIELKMWASTGKGQVENQVRITREKGIKLIYVVIGYPDKILNGKRKKNKETNYVDTFTLVKVLKSLEHDSSFCKEYSEGLKKFLIDARDLEKYSNPDLIPKKKYPFYFSWQNFIREKLKQNGIESGLQSSNEGKKGKGLRCFIEGLNDNKSYHDTFHIYIYFINEELSIQIYTCNKDKTSVQELKDFIKLLKKDIPEKYNIRIRGFSKVPRYKIIFKVNNYFPMPNKINDTIEELSELIHIIKKFNPQL